MPATNPTSPRILLLEDDPELLHDVLTPGLREYGFTVEGVQTAAALYDILRARAFDIVVLDVGLPDADGFSVAQALRAMWPGTGIIMQTSHGGTSNQVRGLTQGADAYLVKPVQVELLAATARSLARRLQGVAPQPVAASRWQFDSNDWCMVSPMGRTIPLTNTEQRIMARLASSLGQLVTRDQLASVVSDNVHDFDPHRIEMVIHRLRRKVASRCGESLPLSAVHGKGYVLDDAPVAPAVGVAAH